MCNYLRMYNYNEVLSLEVHQISWILRLCLSKSAETNKAAFNSGPILCFTGSYSALGKNDFADYGEVKF